MIWSILFAVARADDADATSLFQIEIPNTLYKDGGYKHKEAMFGTPTYGITLTETLYWSNTTFCDANSVASGGFPVGTGTWHTPYLLMVNRGDCTFVTKVRNAQRLGASGVVIADNTCVCGDADCPYIGNDCEGTEPIMADDGSGSDISIPAILLWKSDADRIKDSMMASSAPVQAKLEWSLPAPDNRVEWEIWTTSIDFDTTSFLTSFQSTVEALGVHQQFTPHAYTYNGTAYDCQIDGRCGSLCTNGGRYCAPDPDGYSNLGLSGADVVEENLRRTCLWKLEGGTDQADESQKGVGTVWWDYVSNFTYVCDSYAKFKSDTCYDTALRAAGADVNAVTQCMTDSGGYGQDDGINTILEHELEQLKLKSIYVVPECIINGQSIWGTLSTQNVLTTICQGYLAGTKPDACNCEDLAANTASDAYARCLANATDSLSSGGGGGSKKSTNDVGMPGWAIFLLVISIIAVMLVAGLVYWKRTQAQMRDQVRGILAEYMPLDDVGGGGGAAKDTNNAMHGLSIQA